MRKDDPLGVGWIATIEAYDSANKLVSRASIGVTGCEANKLGPELGRMLIINNKTNYWTLGGGEIKDKMAEAVCAGRLGQD